MTILYLLAAVLVSYKVTYDLDAFTEGSKRRVDMLAFLVIGLIAILLALAIGGPVADSPFPDTRL